MASNNLPTQVGCQPTSPCRRIPPTPSNLSSRSVSSESAERKKTWLFCDFLGTDLFASINAPWSSLASKRNRARAPKNPMPFMNAQDTNCVLYPIHLPVAYQTDSRNRAGQGRTLALGGRIVRFLQGSESAGGSKDPDGTHVARAPGRRDQPQPLDVWHSRPLGACRSRGSHHGIRVPYSAQGPVTRKIKVTTSPPPIPQ